MVCSYSNAPGRSDHQLQFDGLQTSDAILKKRKEERYAATSFFFYSSIKQDCTHKWHRTNPVYANTKSEHFSPCLLPTFFFLKKISCLHSLRKAERKTEIKNVNQMCSVPLCCNYLRKRQRKDMSSVVV